MASSISLLRFSPLPALKTLTKPYPPPPPLSSSPPPLTATFLRSPTTTTTTTLPPLRRNLTVARMSYNPSLATERLLSAVAYALPLFTTLPYGRSLFATYPSLAHLFDPVTRLQSLYRSVPFGGAALFFALYLGVVRNRRVSGYARFNAMQAIILDALLLLPVLLAKFLNVGRTGMGPNVFVWAESGVFLLGCFCVFYGFVGSVLGKTPRLPFIGDAAGPLIKCIFIRVAPVDLGTQGLVPPKFMLYCTSVGHLPSCKVSSLLVGGLTITRGLKAMEVLEVLKL
ncbi:hypothetical protein Tsubulata_036164 [Turnera subulata]|uniref:Protein TIC 20 n=1 Tax=Turnera subulata TaxID=218843 RepID=A0A9Q0J112_9ROSI|nr:hypothetical protein Tsubulata_036164 [Turnera subulata]